MFRSNKHDWENEREKIEMDGGRIERRSNDEMAKKMN